MTDVVDAATRSRMMSGIGAKHTKPEMVVRKALFASGYRFRLHQRDLPGAPDVVMSGRRIAVFVHGCFWHMHAGCRYSTLPANRADFWLAKLLGNRERDLRAVDALRADGWRVLVVWECATRDHAILTGLSDRLATWVEGQDSFGEISGSAKPKNGPLRQSTSCVK